MPPTIVITGATSGIGQRAAIALALQGATLVLTARRQTAANATVKAIKDGAPEARVHVYYGDFLDLGSVATLGHEIAARHRRIDVLINNAGVHAFQSRITVDGYAEMISVNYLAPWLLTNILLPNLRNATSARIITVASEASRQAAGFDPLATLTDRRPFSARGSSALYAQSKLMDIMFSMELARRLTGSGVVANCLCPGFNVTGLGRDLWFAAPLRRLLTWLNIGNPERGAQGIVKLASAPAYAAVTGGYFFGRRLWPLVPVPPGADADAQRRLWEETAERVAAFTNETADEENLLKPKP